MTTTQLRNAVYDLGSNPHNYDLNRLGAYLEKHPKARVSTVIHNFRKAR